MKRTYVALAILVIAIATAAVGCKHQKKAKPQTHACHPLPDFSQLSRDDLRFEVMQTVDMFNITINRGDIEYLKCLLKKIEALREALGPEDKSAKRNLIKLEAMGYGIINLVEEDEVYP